MGRNPTLSGQNFPLPRQREWQPSALPATFVRGPSKRPVLIDTDRFRLRSLTVQDVSPDFCDWFLDPDMQRGLNVTPEEWTKERVVARLQALTDSPNYFFGIFVRSSGKLIGFCAFDVNPRQRTAELTVGIGEKEWRGRRVLSEVGQPLVANFMTHGSVDRVVIHILASNRKILFELIGSHFSYEGRLREAVLLTTGKREDLLAFAVLKSKLFPG